MVQITSKKKSKYLGIAMPLGCHGALSMLLYLIGQSWSSINSLDEVPVLPLELCDRLLFDLEEVHGSDMVQTIMCYIACSYGGLYRNELLYVADINVPTLLPILFKLSHF